MTRQTIGGIGWLASSQGASALLRIVTGAILARLLTPADFGLVTTCLVLIGFAEMIALVGFGPALVQIKELSNAHIRTAFTFSVAVGVLTGIIFWIASPQIAGLFNMPQLTPILRCFTVIFPLQSASVVCTSLLQRELMHKKLAGIDFVSQLIGYCCVAIPLALLNFGPIALVGGTVMAKFVTTAMLFYKQPHSIMPLFDTRILRQIIGLGSAFSLAQIFNFVGRRGTILVVGKMLGASAVGIYGKAYNLMDIGNTLLTSIVNKVLFPAIAKVQDDKSRVGRAYTKTLALLTMLVLPSSAMGVVLAPELVLILLGNQWGPAVVPLQILFAGMVFRVGYKVAGIVNRGAGVAIGHAWRQGVYACTVVGGALLACRWGLNAVAASTLLALGINYILSNNLVLKTTQLTWKEIGARCMPAFLLTGVLVVQTLVLATVLRSAGTFSAVILAAAALCAAVTVLLVLRYGSTFLVGSDTIWMINNVLGFFPKRKSGTIGFVQLKLENFVAKHLTPKLK